MSHSMTFHRTIWIALLTSIFALGCETGGRTPASEPQNGLQVIVAAQSATECAHDDSNPGEFPGDVERFVVTLTGDNVDFQTTVVGKDVGTHGEILIQHVPPGEGLTLDLFGCNSINEVTWAGRATNVSIQAHKKTAPALYFTKKGVFNCTGSPLDGQYEWRSGLGQGYAFGAATLTATGSVLLTGGFGQASSANVVFFDNSNKNVLELVAGASSSLVEYRPGKGLFAPWNKGLLSPRGLHHVVPFDDASKLLIIGGVTRAHVHTSTWAPVGPANRTTAPGAKPNKASAEGYNPDGTSEDSVNILPKNRLEVVDVITREVTASSTSTFPATKILPLNAVATYSAEESFVMTGGMELDGSPANHIVHVQNIANVILAANVSAKTGTMTWRRMGHTMTPLSNDTHKLAFVVGGNFVEDQGSTADTFAELIVLPNDPNEPINSTVVNLLDPSQESTYATAFHQTVLLSQDLTENCTATFLVAGGVNIIKKPSQVNTQPQYSYQSPFPKRLDQIVLTSICSPADATSMAITSLLNHDMSSPSMPDPDRMVRALHTMTALADGMVLIAGGYNQASDGEGNSYCDDLLTEKGCFFSDALLLDVGQANSATIMTSDPEAAPLTFGHARFGHSSVLLPDGTLLAVGGLACSTDDSICMNGGLSGDAEIFNPLRPGEDAHCQSGGSPEPETDPNSEPALPASSP